MSDKGKEIPIPDTSDGVEVIPGVPRPTDAQVTRGILKNEMTTPETIAQLVDELDQQGGPMRVRGKIGATPESKKKHQKE